MGNHSSEWETVTSGVPQGSVLGPLLFIIYINDLPESLKHFPCRLYADDSKVIAEIKNENDAQLLQQDLDSIVKWTDTWLMRLNFDKCKVMHFGRGNPKYEYTMSDISTNTTHKLLKTDSERDLGITLSSDCKWHAHTNKIVSKTNGLLGWFKDAFMCRDADLWKRLYSTYIRPHLEFAVPVWNVYSKGDIGKLERVQRRATKVSYSLRNLKYDERLRQLGFTTLEERRKRGDCIQQFKILTGRETVNWAHPPRSIEPMYGHRARLQREIVNNCGQRSNFFSNRIVNLWNGLPGEIVSSNSVNAFKNSYDRLLLRPERA